MFDKEETGWRRGEKRGVVAVFNCPPAAPVRGKACPLTALDLKIWLFGFYAVLWLASVFSSHVSVSGGWQHKRCAEQHKSAVWWLRTTRDEKSQNQFNISNITDGHADFFSMSSGLSPQSDDSEADMETPSEAHRRHLQPASDRLSFNSDSMCQSYTPPNQVWCVRTWWLDLYREERWMGMCFLPSYYPGVRERRFCSVNISINSKNAVLNWVCRNWKVFVVLSGLRGLVCQWHFWTLPCKPTIDFNH